MADEVLGITGVVNIEDIKTTFEELISSFERVGAKTDELSDRMTKALSDIASSNGGDKASKAMEVLRQVIAEANKELSETPLMIANASKEVSNIEKAIAKLEEKQSKSIVGSKDFDSINKQLENERQALQTAKEDVEDLTQSQTAAQQSVSDLLELYGKLAGNIDTATTAKESINEATENEKRSIKELRDEYKQYQKNIQEINNELEKLNAERTKQQNKVIRYQSKSDALAANGATKGGYDSQSADYRNSLNELEKAKKKLEEIDVIQARLNSDLEQYTKEAEDVKDAIDNYGNAAKTKTPTAEYRALRNEIISLSTEYKNMSDAERSSAAGQEMKEKLDELKEKAADLKLQISATSKKLTNEASPTKMFQGVSQGLSLLVSGFATAQGAASALGLSEKDLAEVQTMLQTSLAANNFLTETRTALLKSSSLMLTINTVQEWASQKAIDMETAAKGRGVIATTALTVAQKAFNLVAKANPYVLLATALLTVVGAVAGLTVAYRNNKKAAEEAQKAADERNAKLEEEKAANEKFASTMAETASEQIVSYQKLRREWSALGNDLNAKKKFITDNQGAFHNLGFAVNGLMDAENLLVRNTDSVVNAIMLRAQAAAYEQRITDLTTEKIKKQALLQQKKPKYKAGDTIDPSRVLGDFQEGRDYTTTKKERRVVEKMGTTMVEEVGGETVLTATGARNINRGNAIRDYNRIENEYNGKIKNAVQNLTELQGKIRNTISNTGLKQYTPPTKTTSNTSTNGGNNNDGNDKIIKAQEDLNKELASLRNKNENDEIENLEEGREKRIREIKQEHKEELEEVIAQAEKIAKLNKEAKTAGANETLTVGGTTVTGLTKSNVEELNKSIGNTEAKYNKQVDDVLKSELESMRDYLKEYGTYYQQKLAIAEEYAEKIKRATTEGEKKRLQKEEQKAYGDLDFEHMKKEMNWEVLFGNLNALTKKELSAYKQMLDDFRKSDKYNTLDLVNKKEFEEKYKEIVSAGNEKGGLFGGLTQAIKDYELALTDLATAQEEYNAAVASGSEEAISAAREKMTTAQGNVVSNRQKKKDAEETTYNKLMTINDAIVSLGNASEYSVADLGKLVSTVSSAFGEVAGKVGGIIGAILAIVDSIGEQDVDEWADGIATKLGTAIGSAFDSKYSLLHYVAGGLLGSSDKTLTSDIENLTTANESLQAAIEDLADTMDGLSIPEATEALAAQLESVSKMEANTQEIMSRMAANYSNGFFGIGGSQSSNNAIDEWFRAADLASTDKTFRAFAGDKYDGYGNSWEKISELVGKSIDSAGDFFSLSAKEMLSVKENLPYIYEKIKELADDGYKDAAQYMDAYTKYAEQVQELEEAYQEKITDTSFDTIKDDFRSALTDMDSDAEDFSNNFEKYMREAVVESLMTSLYDDRLKSWYEKFASAMESGGKLTNSERDALEEEYNDIVSDALAMRDELENMGLISDDSDSSQSSSYGESSSITQDQASEISGRLTAIQWNGEQRLNYAIQQTALMTTIQLDTEQLRQTQETMRGYVSELLDIQQDSLNNLQKIVVNTNPLPEMKVTLDDIYKKIKNL